jgi:hypothetical protein
LGIRPRAEITSTTIFRATAGPITPKKKKNQTPKQPTQTPKKKNTNKQTNQHTSNTHTTTHRLLEVLLPPPPTSPPPSWMILKINRTLTICLAFAKYAAKILSRKITTTKTTAAA